MNQDQSRAYREALMIVSALKKSMEHALRSDPNAVRGLEISAGTEVIVVKH